MKIINNVDITLKEELEKNIKSGSIVNVAAAIFSMYAYEELKNELEKIEEFNYIFTKPTFLKEKASKEKKEFYIPRKTRESSLYGSEFEIKLKNELTQKAISKECADWIRRKCKFKSNNSHESMPGFMTVSGKSEENIISFQPIEDFSTVTLGKDRGNFAYQCIAEYENNNQEMLMSKGLLQTFKNQWNDNNNLEDVTNEVLEIFKLLRISGMTIII